MAASKRVIIDKAQPGGQYKVGQSYTMPAIAADAFIKKGHAHVFGKEDWARQQAKEKADAEARAKAKEDAKAKTKRHHEENEALLPLVEAKDALTLAEKRLADSEKRLAGANGKKRKEWEKVVKGIKADRDKAKAAVDKLTPAETAPDPKVKVKD